MIDAIRSTIVFAYLLFTSLGGPIFIIWGLGVASVDEFNLGRLLLGIVLLFLFFVGLKLFTNDE